MREPEQLDEASVWRPLQVLWSRRSISARSNEKAAFRSCAWLAQHPPHSLTSLLLTPLQGTDQRAKFAAVSALLGVCDNLALLALEPSQALQHVSKQALKIVDAQKAGEALAVDSISTATSANALQQTCTHLVQLFVPSLTSIATAGAAKPTALTASAAECVLLLAQALCQQPYDSSTAAATSVALRNSVLVLDVISGWYSDSRTLYRAALQSLSDTIQSNSVADNAQAAARHISHSVQYIIGTTWPTAQLQKVKRTLSPAELLTRTTAQLIAEAASSNNSNVAAEEHAHTVIIALCLAIGEHDATTVLTALTTADASLLMQLHSAVVTCMRSSAAAVSLAIPLLTQVYIQSGVVATVLSDKQAVQLLTKLLPLLSKHNNTAAAATAAAAILQHTAVVMLQRPELLLPLVLDQLQQRAATSPAAAAAVDRTDVLRLLATVISQLKSDAYSAAASSRSVLMQSITERVIDTLSDTDAAVDTDSAPTAVLLQLEPTQAVTRLCSMLSAAASSTTAGRARTLQCADTPQQGSSCCEHLCRLCSLC
jgi:hypothetical protein